MTVIEIGKKLVELCAQGKNEEAMMELYSPHIVSIEPMAGPEMPAEMSGIEAVLGKGRWWMSNNEIHSAAVHGPYPHGDRFIVYFDYDVTYKPSSHRMRINEAALYTVADGKIVKEEFFYTMG